MHKILDVSEYFFWRTSRRMPLTCPIDSTFFGDFVFLIKANVKEVGYMSFFKVYCNLRQFMLQENVATVVLVDADIEFFFIHFLIFIRKFKNLVYPNYEKFSFVVTLVCLLFFYYLKLIDKRIKIAHNIGNVCE